MTTRTLHDIRCNECGRIDVDVVIVDHTYPRCERCGAATTWVPVKVTTDLWGSPQYSDATGEWHSSQREKIKRMREIGRATTGVPYTECGDKDGGARPELKIKRTGFSYAGQRSRISTGEKELAR